MCVFLAQFSQGLEAVKKKKIKSPKSKWNILLFKEKSGLKEPLGTMESWRVKQ